MTGSKPAPIATTRTVATAAVAPEVAAIRSLAGAGQHVRAVDLAGAALDAPRLTPAQRMSLLEARSESLLSLAESARAEADASEAWKIAEASGSSSLRIRARLCQASVLSRLQRNGEALPLAVEAVAAARRSRNRPLLAMALLRQAGAEIAMNARSGEAEDHAAAAAALFEKLGNGLRQGRALRIVAAVRLNVAITDENLEIGRRRSRLRALRVTDKAKASHTTPSPAATVTSRSGYAASRRRCRRLWTAAICSARPTCTTTWPCSTAGLASTIVPGA